ncbi:MAG: hypothetical protein A3C22_01125 [Candidatus Levybacteria bacterium RIFCSPHIGHO2_02_FULL_37_10]|nr:MAG: hypothetical protein A3C22_01125 [Candidatus Levybacteria bacterium RIFCSPHIGHO2_02_FULL_37_10]OGH42987.1 MAG: hypothetical protein A3B53_03025 [Candidatus Levybacteria bacterium RIFCSPLOWO2_01_FULL_42_15]
MTEQSVTIEPNFESRRRDYFAAIAVIVYPAIELHKAHGHYEPEEFKGKHIERGWGNVTEHCLVEAARAGIFADLLEFSRGFGGLKQDAMVAAGVHDFRKKREITSIREGEVVGTPEEKQNKVTGLSAAILQEEGSISDQAKFIAGASGAQGVLESEAILDELIKVNEFGDLGHDNDVKLALLVQHYIDDYTDGAKWAPEVVRNGDGTLSNALNQRLANNRIKYKAEDEDGRTFYGGRTTSQAQEECSTRIQDLLVDVILDRNPEMPVFEPYELPEIVDNEIRRRISS